MAKAVANKPRPEINSYGKFSADISVICSKTRVTGLRKPSTRF